MVAAWLLSALATLGTDPAGAAPQPPASQREYTIRIGRARDAEAVRSAVRDAAELLAQPGCRQIFQEFRDAQGRTLQEKLDALQQSGPGYLSWIFFIDGLPERACRRRGAFALTEPGSRVVRICTQAFVPTRNSDPARTEVTIIHEALHSLGLPENPPTPAEINARVTALCLPRP